MGYHIGLPATFYTPKPPSNIHPHFNLNVGELQISSSINAMKFLRAIGDKFLQLYTTNPNLTNLANMVGAIWSMVRIQNLTQLWQPSIKNTDSSKSSSGLRTLYLDIFPKKKENPFFCSTFRTIQHIQLPPNRVRRKAPEKLHPSGVQDHCVPNIDNGKVREKRSVEVNSKGCSWYLPGRMGKKRWNPLGIFPLQMGVMSKKIWGVGMGREWNMENKKTIGSFEDRC